jgi:hypothetical protein
MTRKKIINLIHTKLLIEAKVDDCCEEEELQEKAGKLKERKTPLRAGRDAEKPAYYHREIF